MLSPPSYHRGALVYVVVIIRDVNSTGIIEGLLGDP